MYGDELKLYKTTVWLLGGGTHLSPEPFHALPLYLHPSWILIGCSMHCLGSKLQIKVSHGTGKRRGRRVQSQMPTPSFQQLPLSAFASNRNAKFVRHRSISKYGGKWRMRLLQESQIVIVCHCDRKGSVYAFERPMLTSIPGYDDTDPLTKVFSWTNVPRYTKAVPASTPANLKCQYEWAYLCTVCARKKQTIANYWNICKRYVR